MNNIIETFEQVKICRTDKAESEKFQICLAQDSDISLITKLLNSAYKELADMGLNYTASYQNEIKTKERISEGRCFVLKNNENKIIGTILITIKNHFTNNHTAYLGQFGILPEYKSSGLGTRLLEFCEGIAMNEGFSGMQLDTAIPAKHLVDWYQRRDYKIIGQLHFDGKTYNSYVFEKIFESSWERYYQKNKGRAVRPLFTRAISYVINSNSHKTALDLGCGVGIETSALIRQDFMVIAVDNQKAAGNHIRNQLSLDESKKFNFVLSDFSNFEFDTKYDFVWAYHSLPFISRNSFFDVVNKALAAVKDSGVFAGSFFGEKDEWVLGNKVNGICESKLRELFSEFNIIELKETFEKGKTVLSSEKNWHIFDIIARKI